MILYDMNVWGGSSGRRENGVERWRWRVGWKEVRTRVYVIVRMGGGAYPAKPDSAARGAYLPRGR